MDGEHVTSATFALLVHWAVGVAVTVAVADREAGWVRDHPLFGRRLSGRIVPPMAAVSLAAPVLLDGPLYDRPPARLLMAIPLLLPFVWLSWRWSQTWSVRCYAFRRRRLGIMAAVSGVVGLLVMDLMTLATLKPDWRLAVPMGVFVAGVALPGCLTKVSIVALTAGLPAEVPGGKTRSIAEVGAIGLLTTLLTLVEVVLEWLHAGAGWPAGAGPLVLGWASGALAVPGLILLLRLRWRTMPDAVCMPVALVAALAGQWLAYLLMFGYPGLVPYIGEWT